MNATRGLGPKKQSIMAGRKGFMAEHKPGFPDAYDERMLNHERLRNEQLTVEIAQVRAERDRFGQRLDVMTEELARAVVRIVDLKSQKSDLMGVCNDLRERLDGLDDEMVLDRREIFNLQKSNETLKKRIRSCHE